MSHQDIGLAANAGDWSDVAYHIEIELLVERRIDHVRRSDGGQRVTVRRRTHDDLGMGQNRRCRRGVMESASGVRIEPHTGLMLPARITWPHFSVSSAMSLPKSAGEPANTVPSRSASRSLIFWSARR